MLDHPEISELYARYEALIANGAKRARDAAAELGVSEAELVEAKGSAGVSRALRQDPDRGFAPLLEAMTDVGEVMVLTRNEHSVHERHGQFANINIGKIMGLVLNKTIDLRLFMNHWASGFAVEEEVKSGKRLSMQFFDHSGEAVHKIYVTAKTNRPAFEALVDGWVSEAPEKLFVLPPKPLDADRPDAEIDIAALRADWLAMKDTHEFFGLLKKHKVGRLQALRLVGEDLSHRLDNNAVVRMLELAAAKEAPIMCFVGNRGCIQIHSGPVKSIKAMGPWINVLDPDFNLHLRTDRIAETRIVRKPTSDGIVTSLEVFDADGVAFCMFFGVRHPGEAELDVWRAVLADLELEAAS